MNLTTLYSRQSLRLAWFLLPEGSKPEVIVWRNQAYVRRLGGGYQQTAAHQIGDFEVPVKSFVEQTSPTAV